MKLGRAVKHTALALARHCQIEPPHHVLHIFAAELREYLHGRTTEKCLHVAVEQTVPVFEMWRNFVIPFRK